MQPNIIQNPVVNERLGRFMGARQGTVCPTLAPELQPVIIVDDLSRTGKGGAISAVRPWAARAFIQAVNFPAIRITNMSANYVQRIRKLTLCSVAVSQPVYMEFVSSALTGAATPTQAALIDTRQAGQPAIFVRSIDVAVGPVLANQFFETRITSGGPTVIEFPNPIVLSNGFVLGNGVINSLWIMLSVAASTLVCTVEGEEESAIG